MKSLFIVGLLVTMLVMLASPVMAGVDSWGVGAGIPYGYIGVNLDFNIIPDIVDLSLGLGSHPSTWGDDDWVYNAGLKIYLAPEEKNFRPRLSCYYGTNTYIREEYWGVITDYTAYNGVTAGIGASVAFGHARRHGLDFDLLYCVSTKADRYLYSDFHDICISAGYRQFF